MSVKAPNAEKLTTTRSKRSVYRQPNKEVPKNQGIVSVALAYCRRGRLWLARRTKRLPYLSRSIGQFAYTPTRKPVPLDAHVAADLWLWKEASKYSKSDDWIFATPDAQGRFPYWPDILLLKIIQPPALRAGIKKRVGWHTFRHSYSSLLVANGENVKVVQELMRHASSRFPLDVYSQHGRERRDTPNKPLSR